MILKALHDYYHRLTSDPSSTVASQGFSSQKISFAIVLDERGNLIQVQDLRDQSGKNPRPLELPVPEPAIRTVGISPNFMWDNTGYVLGADEKGKPDRSKKKFAAFRVLQHRIGDTLSDTGMVAVLRFLDNWLPEQAQTIPGWPEQAGANLVFRLIGETGFVHDHPDVRNVWINFHTNSASDTRGMCLIQGENAIIAALHAKIKGVQDAQSTGASLVSFNQDAFCSYGKDQNFNAPIGECAVFAYTTALNHLLRFGSRQKLQLGNVTTVFWTERTSPVEDFMGNILNPQDVGAIGAADAERLRNYLKAIRAGHRPEGIEDEEIWFFILGLTPNAARLAVCFWYTNPVKTVYAHLGKHFADLELLREFDNQPEYPGVWQLLIETVRRHRRGEKPIDSNLNPLLTGAFMRSILEGRPYPSALLSSLIGRIRADGSVNYFRMALIKAVLIRNYHDQGVTVSLNENSMDVSYRLGRLFAVLEKAQEEAIPGANATIKDRFFGSASATPSVVFPQLLRLAQHHLAKLDDGSRIQKERLIQGILDGIEADASFPRYLSLESQGRFALGYYHQRKFFFTKNESK